MSMKKILCLVLAVMLCGLGAFAESDADRIAELEALVALYKPFYDAQVAAEYDGGVITVDEVMEVYNYYASMFSQYGISLETTGYADSYKQQAVETLMQQRVIALKAAELGLDQLSEEEEAALQEEAQGMVDYYIETAVGQAYPDQEVTDEMRAEVAATLEAQYGYNLEYFYDSMKETAVTSAVQEYIIKDVEVNDEEIQAKYDELVAQDQSNFESESAYVSARTGGSTIYWHPDGYRLIKQVLIKFDDAQTTRYNELKSTLTALEAELKDIQTPAEEATEEAAAEEADEEPVEKRTEEEVNADIEANKAAMETLYEELMPTVNEVIDAFNAGTSFEELAAQYNADTGMPEEGYPVKEGSTYFDSAFAEPAMKIESIGQIGEIGKGIYGIYITYYAGDIETGALPLSDVRDAVTEAALDAKRTQLTNDTLTEWIAALNPVYHFENLK